MTEPNEIDLSKCVICGGPAQFTDADPGAYPVSYDSQHLPAHFRGRAESGRMPLQTDETKDELYEAAQKLDVEGRSDMTKAQLQSAVAAAKLSVVLDKERKEKESRVPEDVDREPRPTREAEAVVEEASFIEEPEPVVEEPVDEAPKKSTRRKKGA